MGHFANRADLKAIEAEMPWSERPLPPSIYGLLSQTSAKHGARTAISYQLFSAPNAPRKSLSWDDLHGKVTQTANAFRALGIGENDVVAYVLPNSLETVSVLLGGAVAGIVNPINPLLEPDQIGAILRETGAKVVVTLKAFPKTEVPQNVAEALRHAPDVTTLLEVDLVGYLTGIKRVIVPIIRPKNAPRHRAKVLDLNAVVAAQPADRLTFEDHKHDRITAYFHTGGTTGMPKVAQHSASGMIYNGWIGSRLLLNEKDCVMCPLPLFHVFAVYPILMSAIVSGAHVVFPTPAGYRGEGVFDNLWKLIERYRCTYLITVPTALSALMQRPVDADISSLKSAFSGAAALPIEIYRRFKEVSGVEIVEGYGLTEATCLVSCNPPSGMKKIGSVGLPFPHCDVRIIQQTPEGLRDCAQGEIGEICIFNPGVVVGATYTEADKNIDLFLDEKYLRTGDLGRLDDEGYLYITGRAKDLIIRGGHNIDPGLIEEALMSHPAVALVGAIGQPDAHSGELPCAYVELMVGASANQDELRDYVSERIQERAAIPKYVEVLTELPKTSVGKVFKPDLRRSAITRVYDAALVEAGLDAHVSSVIDDKKRGMIARINHTDDVQHAQLVAVLDRFTVLWESDRTA